MDDFGVLVESIGFKSQRNSAPLANLKGKTNVNHGVNLGFNTKNSPFKGSELSDRSNSINTSFEDNLDGIFQAGSNTKTQNSGGFDVYDDVFGASLKNSKPPESKNVGGATSMFDLNSMFKGSGSSNVKSSVSGLYDGGDDIFGGILGFKSSASGYSDDVFGGMASLPPQSDAVDDLLGNFDGNGSNSSGLKRDPGSIEGNHSEFDDDLIPGFRGSSNSSPFSKSETSNFYHPNGYSSKSTSNLSEGPFSEGFFSDPMEQHSKGSILSSIDELEDFARAKVRNDINIQSDAADTKIGMPDAEKKEHKTKQKISQREQGNWVERRTGMEKIAPEFDSHLDSFFTSGNQSNSMPKAKSMAQDSMFDSLFPEQQPRKLEVDSSEMSSRTTKISSVTNLVDNFSNLFGAPSYDDFQEIEGESKERRKARLNHHNRTQARMAKALAEKNERDFQAQQEQEERHRLGETFNDGVKRWAAGKEGNLRALLSSLQYVLWPESGWQPVSLTDLITTTAVKKVYHKATLYVHPDKVQQKGANLEQKYIAEKVFDLLKEAWSKFNTEELR